MIRPKLKGPRIVEHKTEWTGQWLETCVLQVKQPGGSKSSYEMVSRTHSARAVQILAFLKPSKKILLVEQFRPAAGKNVIELPAGLIEDGENVIDGALRELKKETGYTGVPVYCSDFVYSSPGMTDESVALVVVYVDEHDLRNTNPESSPEQSEMGLQCLSVYVSELDKHLVKWKEKNVGIGKTVNALGCFIHFLPDMQRNPHL